MKYSRRTFSKLIVSASPSLLLVDPANGTWLPQTEGNSSIPDSIAGYNLTDEDRLLASRFLIDQNKTLSELKENDLPNGLAPSFTPISFPIVDRDVKSR